jgi:hypothetical protein
LDENPGALMDLINEQKLQAAGDEVVDRFLKGIDERLADLDGWTLTITVPNLPTITVRLNKPEKS